MSEIEELVKRSRVKADMIQLGEKIEWGSDSSLLRENADALETQAARINLIIAREHQWRSLSVRQGNRISEQDVCIAALQREKEVLEAQLRDAVSAYEADMKEDDARISELEAQVKALREAAEMALNSLAPLEKRVFNDNGDFAVETSALKYQEFVDAYFAHRAIMAALQTTETKDVE